MRVADSERKLHFFECVITFSFKTPLIFANCSVHNNANEIKSRIEILHRKCEKMPLEPNSKSDNNMRLY